MKDQYEDWAQNWHGHGMFRGWHGMQAKRGDIGPIILRVLADKPMHGYEIIQELEKKSHGMWRPSPGSVYPTLQLLEEQEFVSGKEDGGKKIYTITELGRTEAENKRTEAPWESIDKKSSKVIKLKISLMQLVSLSRQILHDGSDEKREKASEILTEARNHLEEILK
ncbi:MAG: PadR family transcriptional regulator [Candidatus Saccharimonadia bacterium]